MTTPIHRMFSVVMNIRHGRGDRTRTCGFYVPNVALYQTELRLEDNLLLVLKYHKYNAFVNAPTQLRHANLIYSVINGRPGVTITIGRDAVF